MQSTLSLTLDITQKKGFFTDTTDYSAISVDVNALGATGSVAIYFQGDLIGSPLTIDLAGGDTTTSLFDLELDLNGNVANGSYSAVYTVDFAFSNTTALAAPDQIVLASIGANYQGFTVGANIEVSVDLPGGALITGASNISGNLYVTIDQSVSATLGSLRAVNVSQVFSGFSWVYSGCTQTTAGVEFTYDCEFGNSGSWAVSNTTVLAANEFITSQVCTINYPSWTNVDPIFNPQVVTTSLPYPTILGEDTPLATGTYSVLLSQQIQQNQASGLIITYSNSITREFTVTCAGTLCGLVPCIENLRAAHATELIRNRISKYQVFVDNVLLYYTEAMNYRACGELDSYKSTIALLQAQLDASGCDCACCDNETYYWVSNNSANSIIDELLANFQYRLFDTGMGDPGNTQAGVELGAIWQNTNTGILYRCTLATPGSLTWALYYDPSVVYPTGADNGLSISGSDVVLGGSLDGNTTIDLNTRRLTLSGTTGDVEISSTIGTALDVIGTTSALSVEGTNNALDVLATTNTAATLQVERATDNDVATNLVLRTSVSGGVGANGLGSSIEFRSEGAAATITTSSIESVVTNASTQRGELKFNVKAAGPTVANSFTLNDDLSATLPFYGDGNYTGSLTYYLGVDVDGNVIESNPVTGASNGLSVSGNDIVLGGSLTGNTTIDLNTQNLTLSGTSGNLILSATAGTALDVSSSVSSALTVDASSNAIVSIATTDVAALLIVNKSSNNTVSKNVILRTTVNGFPGGAAGLGSSIVFQGENNAGTVFDMAEIKTTMTDAATGASKVDFTLKDLSGPSLVPAMTIDSDFSLNLSEYGSGTFTGTAAYSLSVDSSGNVIETAISGNPVKTYVGKITGSIGTVALTEIYNDTGATMSISNTNVGEYQISASSAVFTSNKTASFLTPALSNTALSASSTTTTVTIKVFRNGSADDTAIANSHIKIEIYP